MSEVLVKCFEWKEQNWPNSKDFPDQVRLSDPAVLSHFIASWNQFNRVKSERSGPVPGLSPQDDCFVQFYQENKLLRTFRSGQSGNIMFFTDSKSKPKREHYQIDEGKGLVVMLRQAYLDEICRKLPDICSKYKLSESGVITPK